MSKLEQLNSMIENNKEVLETLPRNNSKNINIYIKKVEELKQEFEKIQANIVLEMRRRYQDITTITQNPRIEEIKKEIQTTASVQYLINDIDTAYEKMDLDKGLVNLEQYQRNDLETVNSNILFCIDKFAQVGIKLQVEDFDYSNFVKEYLSVFISEKEADETDEKIIKDKFDEIYWKCPDLIMQIVLNFKFLYLKNEPKIERYYSEQKEKLIKKYTADDIKNRFFDLERQLDVAISMDPYTVLNKFFTKELNTKDYAEKNVLQRYEMFIPKDKIDLSDEERMDEVDSNLKKLLNSLFEYKQYMKFKFIIENIKKVYGDKPKKQNPYDKIKRQIALKEKNRMKINAKIDKQIAIGKVAKSIIVQRESLIDELKDLYAQLDENKVYNTIWQRLSDNSSIMGLLNVAGSFYEYLYSFILKENKEIEDAEIERIINELNEFRKYPYCTIMKNITILENKDIATMIKEMYQLLGINISVDLEEETIDSLIDTINKILISHNIRKNKIDLDMVKSACDFKAILK